MKTLVNLVLIGTICTFLFLQANDRLPFNDIPKVEDVTFEKNIKPIIKEVCVKCHSQGDSDFTRYRNSYFLRYTIYRKVVIEKNMPIGMYLDDKDRALFRDWINQGALR